jgi:hypothetical protein
VGITIESAPTDRRTCSVENCSIAMAMDVTGTRRFSCRRPPACNGRPRQGSHPGRATRFRSLIRDRGSRFTAAFDEVVNSADIYTVGTVRREFLDASWSPGDATSPSFSSTTASATAPIGLTERFPT